MMITSIHNPTIIQVTKLHQKKHRKQQGLFLVEGYHLYEEAVKAGVVDHVFTTDEQIQGDNVTHVTDLVLEKLAQTKNPQGVLAVCRQVESQTVTDKVLLLDHVQDPGNLGTLMRSALAFGFDTIVLDDTVDVYNDKVLRSTQGAVFHLHIHTMSIPEFMDAHPDLPYVGTAMTGTLLEGVEPLPRIGLILGNEGAGVTQHLLDNTQFNLTIPMFRTESLNVGVAGSIIMYHLRTR